MEKFSSLELDPGVVQKEIAERSQTKTFFCNCCGNFGGLLETIVGSFSETVLEPKNGTPEWLGCGRMRPRGGQNAEEFGSGQKFPPLCTDFLQKSLQDVLQNRT